MTRVLIVDDEKAIRRTLCEFLRGEGYEAEEAEDAESAEQRLQVREFDVVVTDIILPRISGVELLHRLQSSAPNVLVVMMTGEPTVETATASLRAGATDYLFKPITKADILRVVGNATRVKAMADAKQRLEAENKAYRENLEKLVQERTSQLESSEARFRALVETAFDWVWEVDPQWRYTYVSPKVSDLLGYAPEEVLGRTLFDFMPKSEAERVQGVFSTLAARQQPFSALQILNCHRSGRQVVLESSGVPVFGADRGFQGYRGMDRDITARLQLEAQLRQAQKLEAIGQLAGGVAHDFNNIIAAMMMQHGLMQLNPDLDSETRSTLRELDKETRRAADLTRQLLMFSRQAIMNITPLDLDQSVDNLLKMLRRLIGEHIALELGTRTTLPLINADASMIDQMLMNLVVNARDAMPNGGKITISTAVADASSIRPPRGSGQTAGRFVMLTVSDTGHGMDSQTLQRIFEPFFTTKDPGKGTGLGLATVHGIAAQHKGWVDVESKVGIGTTFRIYLPAFEGAPQKPEPTRHQPPVVGGKETLLVVEDQPYVRKQLCRTLRTFGYAVHEASQGKEALALWQQHAAEIDLLFTDMIMPEGISGLELATRLRAAKPTLKVIVSSGHSAELAKRNEIDKAGIHYLPKPFERHRLAEAIRTCLDQE